ncbi:hypothetical protein ABT297_24385 [Dactylosporangium sp. NPDC000555]|uniref:hypothetical protein n=1 Tax=Dactylosporangium sp. NPDC000555 TaxID=3154260 RepID=UPI003321F2D4
MNRLVRAAVHVAWRRWPEQVRDERRQEWEAELAVLASEPGRGRLARRLGVLRFALSLAWSPPVEDEHGVPRGWPEILSVLGRALRAPLALAAAFVTGSAAVAALQFVLRTVRMMSGGDPDVFRTDVDWPGAGLNAIVLVAVAGTGLFGNWLGRRLPVNWAHRGRMGDVGSAVVAPLVLAASFLAMHQLLSPDFQDDPSIVTYLPPDVVPATLVWTVVVVAVAIAVARLTGRGSPGTPGPQRSGRPHRPGLAWLVGMGGGALALSLAGIVAGLRTALRVGLDPFTALLWTPQALLLPTDSGPSYGPRDHGMVASAEVVGFVSSTVQPLLLATVLAITYAAVARRRPEPVTVRLPITDAPPTARPEPARLPLAVAAGGVVLWAFTLTVLTPKLVPLERDHFFGELHTRAHDIRLGALLAALLGVVAAIAARGAMVVPAVLGGAALVTADTLVDRADLGGPVVFMAAAGAALAILAAAVWLGARLGRIPPAQATADRTRLGIAVLAAWSAPGLFTGATYLHDDLVPRELPVGIGLAAAVLLLLAAGVVRTMVGRWNPPLVALPALAVLLTAASWWIPELPDLMMVDMLAPLTVVLTVAAARWGSGRRLVWLAVTIGALVAGYPSAILQLLTALLVGSPLMEAAGYGNPPDGQLILPGGLICGLGLAVLATTVASRRPVPADLPVPVDQPTARPA